LYGHLLMCVRVRVRRVVRAIVTRAVCRVVVCGQQHMAYDVGGEARAG
jgi:hypothetical protein